MTLWDVCIIGGGIAGLRVGIELLKKDKGRQNNLKCYILEKYNYIGGRVLTFKGAVKGVGKVQWEKGAGRISKSHKNVLQLLRHYGLHFIDIPGNVGFVSYNNDEENSVTQNVFSDIIKHYVKLIRVLPQSVLQNNTFGNILSEILGARRAKNIYKEFPYYSEIHSLRADIALESFTHEMANDSGFGVCAEGLSALAEGMRKEFIQLGGKIIFDSDVIEVRKEGDNIHEIIVKNKGQERVYKSRICIGALHRNAITGIKGLSRIPYLKYISMEPLLRIYAVFDPSDGVWFNGVPKVVTDSPVRYIIPINPAKGIIMISYTDGGDAKFIHGKHDVQKFIMSEIRRLFPDKDIPDPVYFTEHYWGAGCSYWIPGEYDVGEISRACLHPLPQEMPQFFMCGESFARNQCWVESALEHADMLLKLPAFMQAMRAIRKEDNTRKKRVFNGGKRKTRRFLFNPDDPSKSFNVYIDKDPSDTIPIKYTTVEDVKNTIAKLEKLYKSGAYPHKRIWQVGMIMKVRLGVLRRKKPEEYRLAKKYFEFLGDRTDLNESERKKSVFHID